MANASQRIKVMDLGQGIAIPMCTRLLADLGADVIKVEPLWGDLSRISPRGGDSVSFITANRNKRSLAVNLKDSRGTEIVMKLAKKVDVVAQNFRPGVMEKLGLAYETIKRVNPRVIYCSLYMYGETGPLAHRAGGDPWAQAMTGVVASVGSPQGPPQMAGHAFLDSASSALAAFAIMAALYERERTGIGQEIVTNLLNVGVFMQESEIAAYLIDGRLQKKAGRGRGGQFPYGAYTAKDGDVVTIFGQDDDEWAVMCDILGIKHLLRGSRYDTHKKRLERKFELYPILDEAFRQKTREEWQQIFRQHKLRCDPCLDYAEFIAHPQFQANDMLVTVNHPRDGQMTMPGSPVKLKGQQPMSSMPPPLLGEHSRQILVELGYEEEEIGKLQSDGVIAIPSDDMFQAHPRESMAEAVKAWYHSGGTRKTER